MPTCTNCSEKFPNVVKIDGKKRWLSNRKYCLKCSPFGEHNTKQIHRGDEPLKPCISCGSETNKRQKGYSACYVCLNHRRQDAKGDWLYGLVGEACWICGYDKGRMMLDFHHLRDKSFGLNSRNVGQLSKEKVLAEARKCVLLCCRCHRECHAGLWKPEEILKLHDDKWTVINKEHLCPTTNHPLTI